MMDNQQAMMQLSTMIDVPVEEFEEESR